MLTEPWVAFAVVVVVVIAIGFAKHCVRGQRAGEAGWLPEKLRDATLAYVERTFRTDEHPHIVARVDRAYRSKQGLITLVELKTRDEARVYEADIIELSAQRLALSTETGEPVAPVAFVVVEWEGRRKSLPVGLMSAGSIKTLVQRREDLLVGQLAPRPPSHLGLCEACVWRASCHPKWQKVRGVALRGLPSGTQPRG